MSSGLGEVKDARVIYLDMNSFFASVEQQYRPELRDKPLAVVSHIAHNGTVLAASYDAKKYGIGTGTKLRDARQMCPGLVVTETTPDYYRHVHEKFMNILRDRCGPEVSARSIDEAVIFLSPNWANSETAWDVARDIKRRFKEELGEYIRCSIGIAPNAILGKVASNLQKPDGLQEISLANLESTLAKLELTDLPGIAHRNALRLSTVGIETPLDLYQASPTFLQNQFGIWGRYWWWRLHGYEADPGSEGIHKSLSHEHVLTKWIYDLDAAWPVVSRMADRLVHRLRRNDLTCRTAWLSCRLSGALPLYAEVHLDSSSDSYPQLMNAFEEMFKQLPRPLLGGIRKISMGFGGLRMVEGLQLDLFSERPRQEELSKAVELIRERYGFKAVQPGTVMGLHRSVAREQLGFGQIKDKPKSLVSPDLT
jgi:DNA polymerase-4